MALKIKKFQLRSWFEGNEENKKKKKSTVMFMPSKKAGDFSSPFKKTNKTGGNDK
jgi:hypothetical protein